MDANGTRFHLLLGKGDWLGDNGSGAALPRSSDVQWDDQRKELTLFDRGFHFVASKAERKLEIDDRRGAARDRYGNWYWIAPDRKSILVLSSGSRAISAFWPPASAPLPPEQRGAFHACAPESAAEPERLQGLCITEDHHLVAGTVRHAGLLVFDLYSAGAPRRRAWPDGSLEPFALAPRAGGGLWMLDRKYKRLWELDRRFDVVASPQAAPPPNERRADFAPKASSGETPCVPPRRVRVDEAWPIPANDPVAVTELPRRGVLVLDRAGDAAGDDAEFARVLWLAAGNQRGSASTRALVERATAPGEAPFALVGHDFALLPSATAASPDRLFIAARDGNQAYAFDLTTTTSALALTPVPAYFPMRLFSGRALVVADSSAWYDCGERWVQLKEQKRPRYAEVGELITRAFDSGEPGCVWHRLMLDACIPPGTTVDVSTRAADDTDDLAVTDWQPEPRPYLRGDGPELPYLPTVTAEGRGTWELLFQRARGRYLQIELVLRGDGRRTPRLRALRAWYPRFSYLEQYLPAVYREDAASASFLDRFLANIEGLFTAIEDRIAAAQILFDVASAPSDALDWLATWFGVALDPAWSTDRRRLFLRHAMDFFAARGTVRGLQMALALALDRCVDDSIFEPPAPTARTSPAARIVEGFRKRVPAGASADIGEAVRRVGDASRVEALWRAFLARRYQSIQTLNMAWSTRVASFASMTLPTSLPASGVVRADWLDFERTVLATREVAHQFTVLIPVRPHLSVDSPTPQRQLALTRAVLDLEKPAHTVYDIRFYWAVFRLGEARLGDNTLVDLGSRAPELMPPMVLGDGYLAEAFLAPHTGRESPARLEIGRDRVGRSMRLGGP